MACLADEMGIAILNPELRSVIEHHRLARQAPLPEPMQAAPSQSVSENEAAWIAPVSALVQESIAVEEAVPAPGHERNDVVLDRSESAVSTVLDASKTVAATAVGGLEDVSKVAEFLTPNVSNPEPELALVPVPPAVVSPPLALPPHERLRAMVLAIDPNAKFVTPLDDGHGTTYFGKVVLSLGDTEPGVAQFSSKLGAYLLHPTLHVPPHAPDDVIEVQYKNGDVTARQSRGQGKGGR
jgi:hypothetical protein